MHKYNTSMYKYKYYSLSNNELNQKIQNIENRINELKQENKKMNNLTTNLEKLQEVLNSIEQNGLKKHQIAMFLNKILIFEKNEIQKMINYYTILIIMSLMQLKLMVV